MSSFIGHSITGAAVFLYDENHRLAKDHKWLLWLIFLAIFPDMEYIALWGAGIESDIRFTHSIIFWSVLPALTMLYIRFFTHDTRSYRKIGTQVFTAAYSHLLLDVLVGVSPLPLLFPLDDTPLRLPFGFLPSAGQIALTNKYFYRNLLIECGILIPLYMIIFTRKNRRIPKSPKLMALNGIILLFFLVWGFSLQR